MARNLSRLYVHVALPRSIRDYAVARPAGIADIFLMMKHRPITGCLLGLLLGPVVAPAEFQLQSEEILSSGDRIYHLSYSPRPAMMKQPQNTAILPTPDGGFQAITVTGQLPDSRVESCLVYLPDADSVWEKVVLDVSPSASSASISFKPVRVGTMTGLKLTASPVDNTRLDLVLTVPSSRDVKSSFVTRDPEALRSARNLFINGNAVKALPSHSGRTKGGGSPAPPTAPGDWRLQFSGEGLFSLDMTAIGATGADVSTLRLDHHGMALSVVEASGDTVWFYANERMTDYNRSDSVFATTGSASPSPLVSTRPAFDTLTPQSTEVSLMQTRRHEWELHYQQIIVNQEADHFAFHVAANPPTSTVLTSYTYNLPFPDSLTSSTVDLTVGLIAQNQNVSLDPDHYTDLVLNGVSIPRFSWEGNILLEHNTVVDIGAQPGVPTIEFTHTIPGVGENPVVDAGLRDAQRLDWVEMTYSANLRAANGETAMIELDVDTTKGTSPRLVTVGGFPGGTTVDDVAIVDVTDPEAVVLLTGASTFTDGDGAIALEFEAPVTPARFFLQLKSTASLPVVFPAEQLSPLPAGTLTGLYVRPDEFDTALQPLVNLRGPGIVEISPRQAYDVFGGGQQHPDAIRESVQWYVENASSRSVRPALLLVGFGTLDVKDHLGLSEFPEVPSFIEQSVQTSPGWLQNGVDFFYACVEGDDELPDLRVARIPAKTPDDITTAVNRIIAHHQMRDSLANSGRTGVFLAGTDFQPFPNTFRQDQPEWLQLWSESGLTAVRIDDGSSTPDGQLEFDLFQSALQDGAGGAAYAQYMGHGFINNWQNNRMMSANKVDDIDTQNRWPFVATYTCFNGLYALPGSQASSLAEAWLFEPDFGAIATLAPVSVDFYETQREFTFSILTRLSDPPATLGDWFTDAQTFYAVTYPLFSRTLHEYVFFGDPDSSSTITPNQSDERDYWLFE